jgi:DnaB-like helicase N terminal domain/AAA domain
VVFIVAQDPQNDKKPAVLEFRSKPHNTADKTYLLPWSEEAEKAALGVVFVENSALDILREIIDARDFCLDAHRKIFNVFISLADRKIAIEQVAVIDELRKADAIEQCGGEAYVLSLVDGISGAMNVKHWAHIIREKAVLRRFIQYSNEFLTTAFASSASAAELVREARDRFAELSDKALELAEPYIEFAPAFLSTEDSPPKYLIDDLIPGGVTMLQHGGPRTKKTWATLEEMVALATGTLAFGLERFKVAAPVPVLYSSQEDAAHDVRIRVKALLRGHGIEQIPDTLAFAVHKGINLDNFKWQEALIKDVTKYGFKFVALDPIRRYSPNTDKGPAEVQTVTGFLRRLSLETGATIDANHHDVKPQHDSRDDRRRGYRASGGDWFAAADCPLAFEMVSQDTTLVIPEDYKPSVDPQPFKFRLETDDPRMPTSAKLVGESTSMEDTKSLVLFSKIKGYLTEHSAGASGSAISKAIRTRKEDVLDALDRLMRSNDVDCYGGIVRGQKKIWFLPTPAVETK